VPVGAITLTAGLGFGAACTDIVGVTVEGYVVEGIGYIELPQS